VVCAPRDTLEFAEIANDRSGRIEDDYAFETACKREYGRTVAGVVAR
jgi:hypothetical protein